MTISVELPLYPDLDYQYQATLQGNSYNIRMTFNEVMNLYTMSLADADGVVIVSGAGLVPNYNILQDYNIEELTGLFLLYLTAETQSEPYKLYPKNLNEYYKLAYLYDDSTG